MLGKPTKFCSKKAKMKMVNDVEFDAFLSRISKTLYYGENLEVDDEHLSYPVIELAAEIYSDLKTGKSIDRLYLNEATEMTSRVKINPCYLVLALLYIERLKDCNSQYLDHIAPSQLFLISLVLASKFHDDTEFELSLSMFDKFQDCSSSEIFALELDFLNAIQWNVHVSQEEFFAKLDEVEKLLAVKISNKRAWYTYTEMCMLMDEAMMSQLTNLLVTATAVCLATYTAGVLTLLASSTLASSISTTAALAILSTTAQLSLLSPPPCAANLTSPRLYEETNGLENALDALTERVAASNDRFVYYKSLDLNHLYQDWINRPLGDPPSDKRPLDNYQLGNRPLGNYQLGNRPLARGTRSKLQETYLNGPIDPMLPDPYVYNGDAGFDFGSLLTAEDFGCRNVDTLAIPPKTLHGIFLDPHPPLSSFDLCNHYGSEPLLKSSNPSMASVESTTSTFPPVGDTLTGTTYSLFDYFPNLKNLSLLITMLELGAMIDSNELPDHGVAGNFINGDRDVERNEVRFCDERGRPNKPDYSVRVYDSMFRNGLDLKY